MGIRAIFVVLLFVVGCSSSSRDLGDGGPRDGFEIPGEIGEFATAFAEKVGSI
jgi:hypothetical protein